MEQHERPQGPVWYWRQTEDGDEIIYVEKGCKGLLLYRHGDEKPYLIEELQGPYIGPFKKPDWKAADGS